MFDINERIIELRMERHWSEYQLAEKSGIGQSTISSWTRTKSMPTVPNLEKICNAFGITLSQFLQTKKNARLLFPLYSRKCFTILTV